VLEQGETACCYAKSEKHWTVDPQGLAWEHFYTMSEVETFSADTAKQTNACCIPIRSSEQDAEQAKSACRIPQAESACSGSRCN
jgi:hypothetical protein